MKKSNKKITNSHIKKGDTGVVEIVFPVEYRAIVKGVNMVKRHVRPSADQTGGIIEKEASIHISNLMLTDKNGEPSRIKKERNENGKKVRVSKKTQEVI